ncbi:MAG: alkaline phosphatase family protein [Acidobacteria bacterium]|nr:alkaline phosphatase family protein [Acidobacteriota bacterium]MBA3806300.1 alkaline phosphatase family protein [Acidobacteriota bacterium]
MERKKVLLVELNELTWNLIDPLIEQGKLPTFARLKSEGTWASPMSVDTPPQMDPWITWTTVYTGRPQADHNVFFLQQPPETIRAPRIWEICHEQGLSVGVYGSLCSWPPQPVKGFYVPDTFAPDLTTTPAGLSPIQQLNLTYTRSIRLPADQDGLMFKAKLGSQLLKLGLSASSITRIVRQLASERRNATLRWRRVALQPVVNFDFFSRLYRRHRPAFATFHTNHVAHYMHTYWKAMQPEIFPQPTSPEEVRDYGKVIEYGYRSADELLKNMLSLLDEDTILVVASSMGQKPFISPLKKGKRIGQPRSLERLMEILDVQDRVKTLMTMSGQFNVYPDSAESKEVVLNNLNAAYIDEPDRPMFYIDTLEDSFTVNLRHYDETTDESRCYFPHKGEDVSFRFEDLVYNTGLVKSGCHDEKGIMMLYGTGIKPGEHIAESNNLDIAPTLLTLLGLPVQTEMKGRVLREAFSG